MTHLKPIALIGLMGSGKSVVARVVGRRLAIAVVDLDATIEAERGLSIAELFATDGETAFRDLEAEALRRAIEDPHCVIACGGGVVMRVENRVLLRERCRTAWLEATPAEAARRVAAERSTRPLLGDGDLVGEMERLLRTRAAAYAEVAAARVDTTGCAVEDVAERVIHTLGTA